MAELDPGIRVDTAGTLACVHVAFTIAEKQKDEALRASANSVMSALTFVLRYKTAFLPSAMRGNLDAVYTAAKQVV